ncbi:MAG: hypothetical protein DWQ34_17845 [Planctomycetota bacterium]|nr:MAG: hypothetical protein DWQ29_10485 [Planctomycetota bacterium]REJ90226.1 MAG: hypothetical protein DWQ34_17845 [Planctomycetota bacterium]REK20828.1 MAG: hypothetical protein DWQ41_23580 [Planctomycetota bacterium]REK36055.1 MAG: hypothetical protein DWQ45_10240 [Planctomycetota bacterium]
MSFVGKILIGVQVVLSILFMCAASAVFVQHTSWKQLADLRKAEFDRIEGEHANAIAELERKLTEVEAERDEQRNRADAVVGDNQTLNQQNDALTEEVNTLNQQLQRQTGIAEAKSNEAAFRQAEAEKVRVKNETLQETLDNQVEVNRGLRDEIRVKDIAYEELLAQYNEMLEENAFLTKVVRLNGLETDRSLVVDMAEPPPPVEGVVVGTRKDKTNRTNMAQISLGTDDGIAIGHILDVYRPDTGDGEGSRYLGRIRIVYATPDEAVGLVVEAAKNGIIEKGDNVSTKL